MGDREVRREDRHGIAEDQIFVSEENPSLAFREMNRAEETAPLVFISFVHLGQAALDSSGIELKADGKPPTRESSLPDVLKRFVAFPKIEPRLFLFRQEIETKCRETLRTFLSVEGGINLFVHQGILHNPSQSKLSHVIPAPYQVRTKLQPESSVFRALRLTGPRFSPG